MPEGTRGEGLTLFWHEETANSLITMFGSVRNRIRVFRGIQGKRADQEADMIRVGKRGRLIVAD